MARCGGARALDDPQAGGSFVNVDATGTHAFADVLVDTNDPGIASPSANRGQALTPKTRGCVPKALALGTKQPRSTRQRRPRNEDAPWRASPQRGYGSCARTSTNGQKLTKILRQSCDPSLRSTGESSTA